MTIYLVACGKEKVNHPVRARDMYTGSYFQACLKYAEMKKNDGVYVLSAKYGIVDLEQVIEPYDIAIDDFDAIEIEQVKEQVIEKGLLNENVIVLGGKRYVKFAQKIWKHAYSPLKGGLLKQIAWLNQEVDKIKMQRQMEMWR
jgi:hypothetical protein